MSLLGQSGSASRARPSLSWHNSTMKIGQAAAMSGVTVKAIRHYEARGLLDRSSRLAHDQVRNAELDSTASEREQLDWRAIKQLALTALVLHGDEERRVHGFWNGPDR